eukprot:snap_masked-scaffold_9-processed-gene-8.28-mRNA-1 protein AED:0.95 eAED:0.95 QI:0/-1/0/1/-1/1/1/0/95
MNAVSSAFIATMEMPYHFIVVRVVVSITLKMIVLVLRTKMNAEELEQIIIMELLLLICIEQWCCMTELIFGEYDDDRTGIYSEEECNELRFNSPS